MAPLAEELDRKFNYSDYLTWLDDKRWEIIEGVVYDMSPAPSTEHQRISFELSGMLYDFLKGKQCQAFAAPFDVRFVEDKNDADEVIENVVQPDIVVICEKSNIDKLGCLGSPDIVIEILSPATAYKDQTEKLALYERHAVKEYWIFNPDAKYVLAYCFEGAKYGKPEYLTESDTLKSTVLEGLKIDLSEIWGNK